MAGESQTLLHGGRRYKRRAPRKGNGGDGEDKGLTPSHLLTNPLLPHKPPHIPLHPLISRGIPSATSGTSLQSDALPELHPFQRLKPLPAIGSHNLHSSPLTPHPPPLSTHSSPTPVSEADSAVDLDFSSPSPQVPSLPPPLTSPPSPSHTVQLCVKLPDGSRVHLTLPTTSALTSLVERALGAWITDGGGGGGGAGRGGGGGGEWVLCTSDVPKRTFSSLSLTLHEAGLTVPCVLHLSPS